MQDGGQGYLRMEADSLICEREGKHSLREGARGASVVYRGPGLVFIVLFFSPILSDGLLLSCKFVSCGFVSFSPIFQPVCR